MIPYGQHYIDEDDIQAVADQLRKGSLTQGPRIAEFEKAVASYVGAKYAVAVSSGTAALHLACLALDIPRGSKVLTSPITFVASANAILYSGHQAGFVDVDATTLNINLSSLEEAWDASQAKAVIPVHFAGLPCEMDKIGPFVKKKKGFVIEDAAHAFGSAYSNGKKVGCCEHSDMTIFSFHPVKAIAAGEAGMITTNDDGLYQKLMQLRNHGLTKDASAFVNDEAKTDGEVNSWYYELQSLGFNYRLSEIHAALGLSQLKKLDNYVNRRKELVARYDKAFSNDPRVTLPQKDGRDLSAHHIYVVRLNYKDLSITRQVFMSKLREKGVGTQVHYIPVHWQPFYRQQGFKKGLAPQAEAYYEEALTLPLYYALTNEQQDRVIQSVTEVLDEAKELSSSSRA